MNTKAIYVVTSQGKDHYLEQFIISAYSLRLHNPDMPIILVTDEYTQSLINKSRPEIHQYVSELVAVEIPPKFDQMQKSRYIKTSLRKIVSGDYLFIDSDTVITSNLSDVERFDFHIGAVLDRHVPLHKHTGFSGIQKYAKLVNWEIPFDGSYFNSGIMYVKDNEKAHKLYEEWHRIWNDTLFNKGISIDQPALAKANANLGYPIIEIDGTYNCQIIENGLKYLYNAKIIHYYASNIGKWDCPYVFRDYSLYEKIRQNGMDNEIKSLIANAKSAFNDKSMILAGNMCDAYYSTLSGIARRIFTNNPSLNKLIDRFYQTLS